MRTVILDYFQSAKKCGERIALDTGATGTTYQVIFTIILILAVILYITCFIIPMLVIVIITDIAEKIIRKGWNTYKKKLTRLKKKVGMRNLATTQLVLILILIRHPVTFFKWIKE